MRCSFSLSHRVCGFHRGITLGLIATTASITLLVYLTAPSGRGPTPANTVGLFLPTIGALVVYVVLVRLHPHCRRDRGGHILALLATLCAAGLTRIVPLPLNEIVAISGYGVVVRARVVCGQQRARLVAGVLVLGVLPVGIVPASFPSRGRL